MSLEQYRTTIGIERLKSFGFGISEIENDENALLELYTLNIKASKALYPILCVIEVELRNSIYTMLQTLYGEQWLENELVKQNILLDYEYNELKKAYLKLEKRYKKITEGKIISELNFGFWVGLCSKKYNPKIWTKKGAFRGVFINYPQNKQEQIHELSIKLTKIKKLRNRVFHYEPIIKDSENILILYKMMREIIGYLPQDNSNLLEQTDDFVYVMSKIVINFSNIIKIAKQKTLSTMQMQEETQGYT